jgi:hypothetical protein
MSYLPEDIREAIITRITAVSTAHAVFYRAPVDQYDAYPAYVLEYGTTENAWTSNGSDRKQFGFNLYVVYKIDETEASRELAEKAISDAVGELYRDVFEKPGDLNLPNGWVRLSNVSWGYGGGGDIPMRMAMLQLEVTVHQDRS